MASGKRKLKTLLVANLLVVFVIVGILVAALLKFYAFKALNETERVSLHEKNIQIIRSVQNEIDQLKSFASDWGRWDDSYRFLQDKNNAYIESNMGEESLENLSTIGLLYLDLDFKEFYSYTSADRRAEFDALIRLIEQKKSLFMDAIANRQQRVLFYHPGLGKHYWSVIEPIVSTNASLPANGYLILTQPIDDQFFGKISHIFGSQITNRERMDLASLECLEEDNYQQYCQRVFLLSDAKALLDIAIADNENKHPIYLQTETDRLLNQRIKTVFSNTLLVLLASGLVIILLNLFIINFLVLRPTTYLAKKFSAIARTRTLKKRLRLFGPNEIRRLTESANLMLDEIESLHSSLDALSRTDDLTKLSNRRHFHEIFNHAKTHAARAKEPLTVLLLDVDYFKQYNDLYGHLAGDQCLLTIATLLKTTFKRNNDIVARYGGEEFVVLLTDTAFMQAEALCAKLKEILTREAIPHATSAVADYVTCSIGGICLVPGQDVTEQMLLQKADELLYQAKQEGRNQAILANQL